MFSRSVPYVRVAAIFSTLLLSALLVLVILHPLESSSSSVENATQLHVVGNRLVNGQGRTLVLRGVDRAGAEYMCVHGWGIFDGPSDLASILPMKRWGINAVRLPLNEACWNGDSYVDKRYSGFNYQYAIEQYVKLLNSQGIVVVLDLHLSDGKYTGPSPECSSSEAVCGKPMPDEGAVKFWRSVAGVFKDDNAIFDLFNEPYPDLALKNPSSAWRCWLRGGSSCAPGISYPAVGMQSLVNTVRSTGAGNVIMLGGISWAHNLGSWLKYEPYDPDHNLAASWHNYNNNPCNTSQCWDKDLSPVLAKVPLIVGEVGMHGCAVNYISRLTSWLGSQSASYFAWAWDVSPGTCSKGSDLITNYDGAPTPFGVAFRSQLHSSANR